MRFIAITLFGLLSIFHASAQVPDAAAETNSLEPVLSDTIPTTDGFYQVNSLNNAVPFAYPEVNLKNVRFYKRIWRDIDLSRKRITSSQPRVLPSLRQL